MFSCWPLSRLSAGLKTVLMLVVLNTVFVFAWFLLWPDRPWMLSAVCIGLVLLAMTGLIRLSSKQNAMLSKLKVGLANMNDGNLAVSLAEGDSLRENELVELFNDVSDKLRRERQHLHQRELLLDKIVNSATSVTVLVDQRERVVFYNQAARAFFKKTDLGGEDWLSLRPAHLMEELAGRGRAICSFNDDSGTPHFWAVSCSEMSLHGMPHELYIFKPMSEELSRQELATWKKAIRVVSHELNNSIAPISSLCHSGQVLAEKLDEPRLDRVFTGIAGRVQHLNAFVKGYAQMAKLSAPRKTAVNVSTLLSGLQDLYPFDAEFESDLPQVQADPAQLEQLFINILNNAQQAAPDKPIRVSLKAHDDNAIRVRVVDQGPGIEPALLGNVLLPFYSTKPNGSGMGLAICREIIEAHGGELSLQNPSEGGLAVEVVLLLS